MATSKEILQSMLDYWESTHETDLEKVKFAGNPEADDLVKNNLFAFLMACSVDRTGNSELLFNIPYRLRQEWGHLDSREVRNMDAEELAKSSVIARAPSQVGPLSLAKTIISLANVVENEFSGHPEGMLEGSLSDILDNLELVYGVGPNIARMTVILRMQYFGLVPLRAGRLIPKIDVHVQRVFTRTGLVDECTEHAVRNVLKGYDTKDVASIDQVCWGVGRSHCSETDPECDSCPLTSVCAKVGVNVS